MAQIANTRGIRSNFAQVAWLRLGSGKLEILKGGFGAPFQDRKDATITKAFDRAIFVEVEPALLLVIEEIKVLLGKDFLNCLLVVFASSE